MTSNGSRFPVNLAAAALVLALAPGGCVASPRREARTAALSPANLRCEYLADPLGIDVPRPRLSWTLASPLRGDVQTAFQVLAASREDLLEPGRADLWDSGKVASSRAIGVVYAGKPLISRQRVFWKVRVWDRGDTASRFSDAAWWETAILSDSKWTGRWIGSPEPLPEKPEDLYQEHPAPLLRKTFRLEGPVRSARVHVSALGYYDLTINGKRVGDRVLDPGWTTYSKRVLYSTYDVTDLLHPGENVIGAMIGNGWYNPLPLRMWGRINLREHLTTGKPRLIAEVHVELAGGSRTVAATDESWRTAAGPILKNSVYLGELYDARKEIAGWDRPGFDDTGWKPAAIASEPVGPLEAQSAPPIKVTRTLRPVALTQPAPGVWVFDLGQNFAGWARLRVQGPAGARVSMRYGELLNKDGTVNVMTSVCGQIKREGAGGPGAPAVAEQRDTYILKGGGPEIYTPRFTFHGFRYVQVEGYPGKPRLDAIEGLRLNAAVEPAGTFECSSELFNRIHALFGWTLLSNLFSVQSDCPAREKFGYGGDIVACDESAILGFDMSALYAKVVRDYEDAARPNGGFTETAPYVGINGGLGEGAGPVGWGTAHPLLVRHLYRYYGNRRLLEDGYAPLGRWIALLESRAKDGILDEGISDHESLAPKTRALTGTAFYFLNVRLAQEIAEVLGRAEDAKKYASLAEEIRAAFNAKFLDPATGKYDKDNQTHPAFALYLDLVPAGQRAATLQALVDNILETSGGHLSTGIFGTNFMLHALSNLGRADVAAAIVGQEDFPGWGYMLQRGATTLWEHWAYSDNTFSHNHPMFGSVNTWLAKWVAGIQPAPGAVGFDKVVFRPQPAGKLAWAKGTYRSIRGKVASSWRREEDTFHLEVSVPPGVTAEVYVPAGSAADVTEGGKPAAEADGVVFLRLEDGAAVFGVGSGTYRFRAGRKKIP